MAQLSVVGLEEDRRSNCSSNDGGVDAGMAVLVLECFSFGFVLVFVAPHLPSPRSFVFDLLGGTEGHRCYEQIMDKVIP